MREYLKRIWRDHPLAVILILGLALRLVAAVASKGYGMHDDHFGPIEQPFQIMHDITYWTGRGAPHGHSIVYPSIHYALFNAFKAIGIDDPQQKMLVVRVLHAFYSLIIILMGYRIAQRLSTEETARKVGIILALFWALPFLSVRNLIEVVCIPPLMAGLYYVLRTDERRSMAFIAGVWFGLAFTFRYQTLSVSGTAALLLLLQRKYRAFSLMAAGSALTALLIQGTADLLAWGYPFASFVEYVKYNSAHGLDYTTGPWYNYTLLVLGAFIPPMSFLLAYGMVRNWKKTLIVLLPVLVFFVLHSYFPNKQERFILPVVPLMLVLGVVGWEEWVSASAFWQRHKTAVKALWGWFWVVNLVLLVPFTVYYSKKARVEAMGTLYQKPVTGLVLVGGSVGTTQPPLFYADQYPVTLYEINSPEQFTETGKRISESGKEPNFVVVFGPEDLQKRTSAVEKMLGKPLTLVREISPSFLDNVFWKLNPKHNKNQTTFVYEVKQ